jgi:hypothetical protein
MVTRTYWVVRDTHHVMRSNKERKKKGKKQQQQEPSPLFVVWYSRTDMVWFDQGSQRYIYGRSREKNIDVRF